MSVVIHTHSCRVKSDARCAGDSTCSADSAPSNELEDRCGASSGSVNIHFTVALAHGVGDAVAARREFVEEG